MKCVEVGKKMDNYRMNCLSFYMVHVRLPFGKLGTFRSYRFNLKYSREKTNFLGFNEKTERHVCRRGRESAHQRPRPSTHTHTKLSVFPLRTKSANSQKILFNRFDVSSGQFFISTLFITSYDESHKFIQFQKWSRNIPNIPFPLLHHCCFFLPVCWC